MRYTTRTYPVAWDQDDLILTAHLALRHAATGEGPADWDRWNGFVSPLFTRGEVDRYAAFVAAAPADALYSRISWDGDTLVVTDPVYADDDPTALYPTREPDYEPDRIEPVDGLYALGAWAWTWYVVGGEDRPLDTTRCGHCSGTYLTADLATLRANGYHAED